MLTETQRKTAQAIINIFETGRVQGEYGRVTLLPGDSGHLTYGRSQTTLASGNLHLLIKAYCDEETASLGPSFRPFLARLADRNLALDRDLKFRDFLSRAGNDPTMRQVQDKFFDRVYWSPSQTFAQTAGVTTPLGATVVYDSCIHGSWRKIRDLTNERHGKVPAINENVWVTHYVTERRAWLADHSNPLLHKTVYRMDTFQELIRAKNWTLQLPIRVRGMTLDDQSLQFEEIVSASAREIQDRVLVVRVPRMKGEDVRHVQEVLKSKGLLTSADGIFGPQTADAVAKFQQSKGLKADGIVGPATYAALGV